MLPKPQLLRNDSIVMDQMFVLFYDFVLESLMISPEFHACKSWFYSGHHVFCFAEYPLKYAVNIFFQFFMLLKFENRSYYYDLFLLALLFLLSSPEFES